MKCCSLDVFVHPLHFASSPQALFGRWKKRKQTLITISTVINYCNYNLAKGKVKMSDIKLMCPA